MANLIFDFDGTLADTLPQYLAVLYGAKTFDLSSLDPELRKQLQQMPLQKVFGFLHVSPWARLRVLWFHHYRMHSVISQAQLFEGVEQALSALKTQRHALYIVTSNLERNVVAFLRTKKLERFFSGVHHINVARKTAGLRAYVEHNSMQRDQTWYIGNEPADMRAAQQVGVKAIGVLWSGQSVEALKAYDPSAIIDSPSGLSRLFIA